MVRRSIVCVSGALFFLTLTDLFSQLPDSTMYPKTVFQRWNLLTTLPDTTDSGSGGEEYKEIDDQEEYQSYDFDDPKTALLRRYDMLLTGAIHVMSFDTIPEGVKYWVYGDSLSHYHIDTRYRHRTPGGSQQSLLAKSKLPAERVNADGDSLYQLILAATDPFRLQMGYVKKRTDSTNPAATSVKRELADWVSPGWFALGVGSTIDSALFADLADTVIWLDDPADSILFYHACTGKNSDPRCSDMEAGMSWDDVWAYTFVMVFPESLDITLEDCYDAPPYEIMLLYQSGMSVVSGDLKVKVVRAYRGSLLEHAARSQIRPLIWTNPNNWGGRAFVMNMTTLAPPAIIDSDSVYWYDMASLWVANHHLRTAVTVKDTSGNYVDDFYLCDGIWLDAYWAQVNQLGEQPGMFLHVDSLDLDLNGISDGNQDSVITIINSWKLGYEEYLKSVRSYTKQERGDSTDFIILTNGTPDTSHYKYINGKYWEDTNGWFGDQDEDWEAVQDISEEISTDSRIVEPRFLVYQERDRNRSQYSATNLKQMRLTLATSLLFTDYGIYGTTGYYDSRSPVFGPGTYNIEDYQDEFAVEDSCYGVWNDAFAKEWVDYPDTSSEYTVPVIDPDTLFASIHYLGEPIDTVKTYFPHSYTRNDTTRYDLFYREFDHGIVFAHYGGCAVINPGDDEAGEGEDSQYQWVYVVLDSIADDLSEDPRDEGYHFLGIGGCDWNNYQNPFNDQTNVTRHYIEAFWLYLYGDGRIILKEYDGFERFHPPDSD